MRTKYIPSVKAIRVGRDGDWGRGVPLEGGMVLNRALGRVSSRAPLFPSDIQLSIPTLGGFDYSR